MSILNQMKFYNALAEKWPTKKDVVSEIINLQAILSLPKGTEHFISDIHGEYDHFIHILRTASGVIRAKIYDVFGSELSDEEQIKLANLIYYPEKVLTEKDKSKEWFEINLLRLIEICKVVCGKYTRSKVRKALPEKYAYIIDELLNCDSKNINKENYYSKIIESIISIGSGEDFMIEIAAAIRRLCIDHLHINGDIFDRGPRPDIVLDTLMDIKSIDVQWGNHDVVWMGAMLGSEACISVAVANSLKYGNTLFLEEGYGVSLRQLEHFANETYSGESNIEKMYKAISVIRFKLEDELMRESKDFKMQENTKLDKIDFDTMCWCGYKLNTNEFPTIDKNNPTALTKEEKEVISGLQQSFIHSEKMQKHINFLFSKGSMYLCYNGNLIYHGCVPLNSDGSLLNVTMEGRTFSGKSYMDYCEKKLRDAYNKRTKRLLDFFWYIWCAPVSPLFGKNKMTTFERMFIDDKESHIEEKQPYFSLQDNEAICNMILSEFGVDFKNGHIINGHIPVKFKDGENPIKANGKLILIDGGMSKTYRKQTGIAGYTLIFNSYGLAITSHTPFESIDTIVENNMEMMSQRYIVEKVERRILVRDTDIGKKLLDDIEDLNNLLFLYDSGAISEKLL